MADWKAELVWLAPTDPRNPFDFEALDCRSACAAFSRAGAPDANALAVAEIETLALRFEPEMEPVDAIVTACALAIEYPAGAPLFAPRGPGHRWSLQIEDHRILARRSWTGQTIHAADFRIMDGHLLVNRLVSDRHAVYDDPSYAVTEFEFLLNSYVARKLWAFPVPPTLRREDRVQIAVSGWTAHGPIAAFARMA